MTDLSTLMNRATANIGDSSPAVIDNDMVRAQQAQRARRRRLGAGGFGGLAVAAALALSLPFVGSVRPASAVELVDYAGAQPAGFTLDEVPEGWHLFVSDNSSLVLSPESDPRTFDPSSGVVGLEGRIDISVVAEEFLPTLDSRDLTIGGTAARAYDMLGEADTPSGVVGVFVPQSDGRYLSVQLPAELNWTDAEASEFIAGIDVDENATPTAG